MSNPVCRTCYEESVWVDNGPRLQYFYCKECKREVDKNDPPDYGFELPTLEDRIQAPFVTSGAILGLANPNNIAISNGSSHTWDRNTLNCTICGMGLSQYISTSLNCLGVSSLAIKSHSWKTITHPVGFTYEECSICKNCKTPGTISKDPCQ